MARSAGIPSTGAVRVGLLGYGRIAELFYAGGIAEVVQQDRTGFKVPSCDVGALAGALTGLLLDRPLAERMGAKGHEFALESFGTESVVGRWVEVYERCKPRSQTAGVA